MTKKMTLEDTFTIAELNTVIASMRDEVKNEIKEIENVKLLDSNNIEMLTARLTALTIAQHIPDFFDELVTKLAQGLEKLREEEKIAK